MQTMQTMQTMPCFYWTLKANSMEAIIHTIDHAVMKCEDLCSKMRRQTAILNELTFATKAERETLFV